MKKKMPSSFGWLEDDDTKSSKYWDDFYLFFDASKNKLFDDFALLFELKKQKTVFNEIKKYVDDDGPVASFKILFSEIKDALEFIKLNISRFAEEINRLGGEDKTFFNKFEKELGEENSNVSENLLQDIDQSMQDNIFELFAQIKSLRKKRVNLLDARKSNLLSVFADHGVLPGYAFPEQGSELELNIRRPTEKMGKTSAPFHSISVTRPAEMALRDLAPFNTFYTHGYKAVVEKARNIWK